MNHASVARKITVFKEQNQQNMNFTQKHNSMNILLVLLKIVLEFLTSAEPLRRTQRTHSGLRLSRKAHPYRTFVSTIHKRRLLYVL